MNRDISLKWLSSKSESSSFPPDSADLVSKMSQLESLEWRPGSSLQLMVRLFE